MQIGFRFPKDFIEMVMLYDGGYPLLNRIIIDGNEEVFNNLISFDEDDESYILDIISDIEDFEETNLVPIAEDPFGNLFCYFYDENEVYIVFWNHENSSQIKFICKTFTELLELLH